MPISSNAGIASSGVNFFTETGIEPKAMTGASYCVKFKPWCYKNDLLQINNGLPPAAATFVPIRPVTCPTLSCREITLAGGQSTSAANVVHYGPTFRIFQASASLKANYNTETRVTVRFWGPRRLNGQLP